MRIDKIYEKQTKFQKIEVFRTDKFGNQLLLDGDIQVANSDTSYDCALVSPLFMCNSKFNIAILGGGDLKVLNRILYWSHKHDWNVKQIDLLELDSDVVQVSRKYLNSDNKIKTYVTNVVFEFCDCLEHLENKHNHYDAIISDLTIYPVANGMDEQSTLGRLYSVAYQALKKEGVFSAQICAGEMSVGKDKQDRFNILPIANRHFDTKFINSGKQNVFIPSFESDWMFMWGRK